MEIAEQTRLESLTGIDSLLGEITLSFDIILTPPKPNYNVHNTPHRPPVLSSFPNVTHRETTVVHFVLQLLHSGSS